MTSPAAGISAASRQGAARSPWIESRGFDLACFILSPLAGLALLVAYPVGGVALAIAATAFIGGPHYVASFTFFLWDEAAGYHRRRWVVHFVVPLLIVLFVAMVAVFRIPAIIMFVIYFWNAYHVSRQSCGILSIYRLRGGYANEGHKRIVNAAIISTGFCMLLWNLAWYPALHELMSGPSPMFPALLWQASAIAAALSLLALAWSLYDRWRKGSAPSMPEWAFLATSLALFHPYLWIRDADLATLAMLMGHFIQYLAIVWLLNRRRFLAAAPHGGISTKLWREPRLLAGIFVLTGATFMLLQLNLAVVTITLVLLHFYLDGVFWAFRRPEVRAFLGPYLTGWRGRPAPATPDAVVPEPRPEGA